jgi:hypothetical protein
MTVAFRCPQVAWQFQIHDSLSSSETRVNHGIRSWKALISLTSISESHWWNLFHKEVKSWESTTWHSNLTISNPGLKRYPQMHLLAERLVFVCNDRGFLKEGVKTCVMAPISPLNSPNFNQSSHPYSLRTKTTNLSVRQIKKLPPP